MAGACNRVVLVGRGRLDGCTVAIELVSRGFGGAGWLWGRSGVDMRACCTFYAVRMFVEGMRFHGDGMVEIRFRHGDGK
jgi:hypothetical protein